MVSDMHNFGAAAKLMMISAVKWAWVRDCTNTTRLKKSKKLDAFFDLPSCRVITCLVKQGARLNWNLSTRISKSAKTMKATLRKHCFYLLCFSVKDLCLGLIILQSLSAVSCSYPFRNPSLQWDVRVEVRILHDYFCCFMDMRLLSQTHKLVFLLLASWKQS